MTKDDISFFNEVRNECSSFLHDTRTYTLEEAYAWFEKNSLISPFFIYEQDGEKIGYFRTSNWTKNSCYLGMDIHKNFRGRGYAKEAYGEFFSFIRKNHSNINKFILEVIESNNVAYNLYKKLGFVEVGRKLHNNKTSITMIKLQKEINL